ncbi:MAG: tRNA 2-selenouridine(34) synthase MnmH [Pseudomonadota bacterium]
MPFELPQDYPRTAVPFDTIIDVRSPAEFAEDRVPGAINLPVLSDEERAKVGTIYVQESPFKARKIGSAIVARNAAHHIETALADHDGSWRPLVYCWRGGQRSGSFASILDQIGWRSDTLKGGYQSYRRRVVERLYHGTPLPAVVLIDGLTGTAKTELLARLRDRGAQVLDLEGIAAHRGSLFGGTDTKQPSQKWFESLLLGAMGQLSPDKPVFVEAESSKIGDRLLPPVIWQAMIAAPRIEVAAPLAARAGFTLSRYGAFAEDSGNLLNMLDRFRPYHGSEAVHRWQGMVRNGDHLALVSDLLETHYDPRYRKSRARNHVGHAARIALTDLSEPDLDRAAERLAELGETLRPD